MLDPTAFVQAMNATRDHVYSARPDAPVVPDRARRTGRGDPLRRVAATVLRRVADRVEPRRARTCSTAAI
ncbi:hypothetical protein Ais01nite_70830 [Asanoa ishikariensis]|uniref:Uncharacterized protein n=1 Tax=Asanoa ishikariensis TaxID=137265 RepID=A0A1H3UPB0_9ACTN|nr:hypothetical protein [Asanoa ishikariensis]GIF69048.1 hypothetical protein Ais01nite_70830 [Asanoa ishikariensis]SDZ63891.1 hypothetical protein SAMN05421684_7617 [Asanoa ishikariensis]